MAKTDTKYLVSYKKLLESFQKEKVPNNILLQIREKVLLDDLIKVICEKFAGKNFDVKNNLIIFNAEDKQMDNVLNECSNTGLFSEKKVIVLKNVKKVLKDAKLSLIDYLKRSNPDSCLIMLSADEEFAVEKIFLFDTKDSSESSGKNKKTIESNVKIFQVGEFTETELISWVEDKFDDFKISKDTIKFLLQFSNNTLDEILSEIEKLKTYCHFTKEITQDAVNLCNGIAKEFNETDFIKAIAGKKEEEALKIYDFISLKKDSEVYLVFILSTTFIIINKLFDPNSEKLDKFSLKRELKIWYQEQEKLLPYYKNYRMSVDADKMRSAFEYIYTSDKLLKTSGSDKRAIMSRLINNLCSL